MRLACWLAPILLIAPAVMFSQGPNTDASKEETNDVKVIRQVEDSLMDQNANADVFKRILADDYVNLLPRGVGPGKSDIVAGIRRHAGQSLPYTEQMENMQIYILGNTAVAAFTKVYTAKENGNVDREDTTHIFQKDRGFWKLKLSRATKRGPDLE